MRAIFTLRWISVAEIEATIRCHVAFEEEGQSNIYRGTPRDQEEVLWESPKPSEGGKGPYQLGIATTKQLVIFREGEGTEREVVWTSH